MRVVIAGGHGKIALLLTRRLAAEGHQAVGLIRNPDHEADLVAAGGEAAAFDIESDSAERLAEIVRGADAVVFAAGAGPNSGPDRKWSVDRDGALKLIEAAKAVATRRYVIVSAFGTDDYDPDSQETYQVYLHAKSDADAAVRASGLDWTVVRPGHLTDDPAAGSVTVAESTGKGSVPRDDVAAVLLACLTTPATVGTQFELIGGDTPVAEALASLGG